MGCDLPSDKNYVNCGLMGKKLWGVVWTSKNYGMWSDERVRIMCCGLAWVKTMGCGLTSKNYVVWSGMGKNYGLCGLTNKNYVVWSGMGKNYGMWSDE
ncbi:hypothetical protein RRG08_057157 [Elysia crispata]|uniref:Uncharacterized protein n=1 Tax=Elysia crispata TaxID=231223 RepID=A0AAE1ARY0_9GAST|nr:hypothetical protein RRG08_057157 [Elysia crispata]